MDKTKINFMCKRKKKYRYMYLLSASSYLPESNFTKYKGKPPGGWGRGDGGGGGTCSTG